jgi:ADP-L-glycero-D-manno-heptose 6-epimerase
LIVIVKHYLKGDFLSEIRNEQSLLVVTGANGFIGSCLVAELNRQGHLVVAVDLVTKKERSLPISAVHKGPFLNHRELWPYLEENKKSVKWVFHMGANSSTTETNKNLLWELNTLYTEKLFSWCTQNNVNLVYASSGATYGSGEKGYDDRTDSELLKPLNLYGESKVEVDRWVLKQKARPEHWYGLKFFNVFGPNEYHKGPMSSVVFKAVNQIKSTGKVQLFKSYKQEFGDGDQMRDFVYVKDIVDWMIELMICKPESGLYNMGFGKARSWNDLTKAVFAALNLPARIEYIEMPAELKNQYQYFTEAKMEKLFSTELSKPKWPLEKAIDDYVKKYLMDEECKYMSY